MIRWFAFARRAALVVTLAHGLLVMRGAAQQPVRRWEVPGFDFSPDGVWRARARRVFEQRAVALARGDLTALNAPLAERAGRPLFLAPGAAAASPLALTGVLYQPVMLARFRNTNTAALFPPSQYFDAVLGPTPPVGRPFSLRTFYEQMSNGVFSVQGQVFGWVALDSNDTWYEGSCNGDVTCSGGGHVPQLIREAVQKLDPTVDFGQFDNDGPDGIPNSGDDDGVVDLAVLIHPEVGGECGQLVSSAAKNLWSHRFSYAGWTGTTLATNDPRRDGNGNPIPGQFIRVNDYTLQSGLGGATACDGNEIMPPGTIAHETGHGFGLPDLYDTDPSDGDDSEGIGEWGLMSSGNYARPLSPAHMEGFSRLQLGWVTLRDLTATGADTLGPYALADTIFRVSPTGSNLRGEYFLVENRQGVLGDTALIDGKGPGLLIFHVDQQQYQSGRFTNTVNSGPIHALWLLQADGLNQLRSSVSSVRNRGDAGDPYPGASGNTALAFRTNPSATLNADGSFAGFAVDSIRQLAPAGAMAFQLRFGALSVVRASDTAAQIRVRGVAYNVFRDLFGDGDTVTIAIDTVQTSGDLLTQYAFVAWSDSGAAIHTVTTALAGRSYIAAVARRYQVQYAAAGSGTVTASPAIPSGAYVAENDSVTLTPVPDAGYAFAGWTGDTATTTPQLRLRMTHPWRVVANFQGQLTVVDTVLRGPIVGAAYADTIRVTGGSGPYGFTVVPGSGSLPPGLSLAAQGVIGGVPTKDSAYAFTVRVTSGTQSLDLPLRLVVTAPTLAAQAVVDQLLLGGSRLTADEQRYLDIIGNNSGQLDVGDLAAWLDRTGETLNPALVRRLAARASR